MGFVVLSVLLARRASEGRAMTACWGVVGFAQWDALARPSLARRANETDKTTKPHASCASKAFMNAGKSSGVRLVMIGPSTTTSASTYSPPAFVTSSLIEW